MGSPAHDNGQGQPQLQPATKRLRPESGHQNLSRQCRVRRTCSTGRVEEGLFPLAVAGGAAAGAGAIRCIACSVLEVGPHNISKGIRREGYSAFVVILALDLSALIR